MKKVKNSSLFITAAVLISFLLVRSQDVPDISTDPYIFQSESLPEDEDGNILLRYMPSIGNGHLATNVYSDTIYVNGLYNGYRGWSYRARIPALHSTDFYVEGVEDPNTLYTLNIREGIYEEQIYSSDVTVLYRTYAHQYFNRVLVTEIIISRIGDGNEEIVVINSNNVTAFTQDVDFEEPRIYNQTYRVSCGQIVIPETETSGLTPICVHWNPMPDTFIMEPGLSSIRGIYFMSIDSSEDISRQNLDAIASLSVDEIRMIHVDSWEQVWQNGEIIIEGDLNLHKVVSGCFYYLYSNLPAVDSFSENVLFYGLSPGGLPNGRNGSDYYGHVFWDMETWMYPGILYFRPDLAREMLQYRIHGMDPAFERAAEGGHNGTRFPWESAYTGVEVTPDICPACRDNQQHITADIAFATRQYISATRDTDFLTLPQAETQYTGYDFIREMAHFWYTRPTYNETKQKYEIKGVMPPDEYAEEVDNSVYTNLGACLSIHFARYAACLAEEDPVESIPDSWINVAENLVFTYNTEKRYHEEFEGYDDKIFKRIKQADVVLLGFPFMWDMPIDVRRNDLETYEAVTDQNGPAMTWGMHSIGWLELNELSRAEDLFNRSYSLYYREPFKVWTEVQAGLGAVNFITGMGGFLQAVVSGYGGLRLHVEELDFKKPVLPPNVDKMTFRNMKYLGNSITIIYEDDSVSMEVTRGGMPLVLELANNSTVEVIPGVSYNFISDAFKLYTSDGSNCELPKDSIDVDYDQVFNSNEMK